VIHIVLKPAGRSDDAINREAKLDRCGLRRAEQANQRGRSADGSKFSQRSEALFCAARHHSSILAGMYGWLFA
jgi:hypothetical protein